MDAVLIGLSDRQVLWNLGGIKKEDYQNFVYDYAKFLAKVFDNIIVAPDDGVYTDIALKFGEIKKKKPIGYYPDKDTYYGYEHLKKNFEKYETRPIDGDWYKLNAELTKQALCIICLGFSPGSLIELSFIKYHQKYGAFKDKKLRNIHLFIDERCISQKLPSNFEDDIHNICYYSSLDELGRLILKKEGFLR
ncbi:Uncharacterised protein [Candidatus Tiddalikarchaeum anstoanum]|nr:Uncharacterised protein [Candidatus Tiddalikarchaeum anstoanum]